MPSYLFSGQVTLNVDFTIISENEKDAVNKAVNGEYDSYSEKEIDLYYIDMQTIRLKDPAKRSPS